VADETRLVADALKRRSGATEALIAHLEPAIRFQATRVFLADAHGRTGSNLRAEVDELLQDVLLLLFEHRGRALRRWDGRASLKTYVARIARHRAGRKVRSRTSNPWYLVPEEQEALQRVLSRESEVDERLAAAQVWSMALERMMDEQTPVGRRIARLLFRDERDTPQVRELTGLSRDAVYQWRRRLLASLRGHATDLLAEQPECCS
jgi:RNA polymerase sigma factor (sigma-70 family)